jgi:superfamily II helicase
MTKVTALEIAVIANVAVAGVENVSVKSVHEGPQEIKATQVSAVILNLKGKGLVTRDGDNVSLTAAGIAVHNELFPTEEQYLENLRMASNVELSRQAPVSEEEQALVAQLVAIRKAAKRIGKAVVAMEEAVKADSEVDLPVEHIESTGLPVQVLA